MTQSVPYYKLVYTLWSRHNFDNTFQQQMLPRIYQEYTGGGVVKRPGWKYLSKEDRNAPLEYHREWLKEYRGHMNWYERVTRFDTGGTSYKDEKGPILSSLFASDIDLSLFALADYKAKAKLFEMLKGEGTNIANMFAERKQAAKSIGNVLNTLVYTVRDLRRGNLSSAIRRMGGDPLSARKLRSKDIAGQWLSLQYGWKPMLDDVYGIVMGLHEREENRSKVFRASGRASSTTRMNASWGINAGTGKQIGTRKGEVFVKYTCRAFPNAALASPAALGLTNPLVPLWEVVPWSFVVDWFLPVGTYLEQLSATHGWTYKDGCISILKKNFQEAQYNFVKSFNEGVQERSYVISSYGLSSYVSFQRLIQSNFPTVSLPRFKNPLSVGHVLNSIALLAGLTNHHDHAGWQSDRRGWHKRRN